MADDLLRRYIGDRRFLLMLPRAVCLQMLHPTIAQAVDEHALLRDRIWLHKKRTVTRAIGIAYADTGIRHDIRFAHEHVKGRDDAGRQYHALDPEVFHFEHATYVESLVAMVNTFIRPLDDDEHARLYRQCCDWYRRYGISTRPMPPDWPTFQEYFEDMCATRLCAGEHFERFRAQVFDPSDWWVRVVPRRAIRAMQHPRALELAGVTVGRREERSLRRFAGMCRAAAAVPALRSPASVRKIPLLPGESRTDTHARGK